MTAHTHYLWFQTKRRQEILDITEITPSVFVNDHESGLWQDILTWLEDTVGSSRSPKARLTSAPGSGSSMGNGTASAGSA